MPLTRNQIVLQNFERLSGESAAQADFFLMVDAADLDGVFAPFKPVRHLPGIHLASILSDDFLRTNGARHDVTVGGHDVGPGMTTRQVRAVSLVGVGFDFQVEKNCGKQSVIVHPKTSHRLENVCRPNLAYSTQ